MSKHILLVHDLAGYGKVSLSAMMPVLSHMGHHLYTLPTALVSNTLDYGKFYIQETTEYMRQSLKVWAELEFSFDVVSTGMILSAEQAALVSDFCEQSAKKGALVFVDPIMGDEGKLYNGVGEETIAHMRKMVAVADCIVPNYTEAAYLADVPYHEDMTEEEARALTIRLHEMGAKSVVVTSAKVDGRLSNRRGVPGGRILPHPVRPHSGALRRHGRYFCRSDAGAAGGRRAASGIDAPRNGCRTHDD